MVKEGAAESPIGSKPIPTPVSQASSSRPADRPDVDDTSSKKTLNPKQFIISVASKIASEPFINLDTNVWGVLTAISNNARQRHQGINMLLTGAEHSIGRLAEDTHFQIESSAVSGKHCKIYRRNLTIVDAGHPSTSDYSVFLKDTSTNGTFLNWMKLNKTSPESEVHHGDIISLAAVPQNELAFTYVYRDVRRSTSLFPGGAPKRKPEAIISESKRLKGIGIGAPEGPISLDDFRSLQRSNTELREQLESRVTTIDTLRNEIRAADERHKSEIRDMKQSVERLYDDQLKELRQMLDIKVKELMKVVRTSSEQKHTMEELNERLNASRQSCAEANEALKSQKASISELEEKLDEERDHRKEERNVAAAKLEAAVQKLQSESQEEIKRLSDAACLRETELQAEINKLQEREKMWCSQVENLRPKLEEARQKLVISDNKVRQLEARVAEEQLACTNGRKKIEELELEMEQLRKELESEKVAREEAWAKVSALELEINAAVRDLEFERRKLKGARERIMLRETQLRAFYSTTEEISALFSKQQEQLKAMQRTLEDEENYENTSLDTGLNEPVENVASHALLHLRNSNVLSSAKTCSAAAQRCNGSQEVASGDVDASVTEKHDCDIRSQGGEENTQEEEFTSSIRHANGGFGSDIDGIGTAPVLEPETIGTEQVPETESPGLYADTNIDLNKCGSLAGDTMQFDDEPLVQERDEGVQTPSLDALNHSQSNKPVENQKNMDDTEPGGTIRTADLITSEVAGSWAYSTAPSVHGENESPKSRDNDEKVDTVVHDSNGQVAESQSTPSTEAAAARRNNERRALSEMIGIVEPDLKEQFSAMDEDCNEGKEKRDPVSSSDTEACSDTDNESDENDEDPKGKSVSDSETEGSDQPDEDEKHDSMDEDT
ncbi:uncharacterized protein [Euphorbia lathyris]|uniref:uncharacterized protein isoform X2 n=1 Tax=Euphorbia lathyris TaxID=212925 RepID=UPI0033140A2B